MAQLPTAEEFFGPQKAAMDAPLEQSMGAAAQVPANDTAPRKPELPTVDEFFAPGPLDLTLRAAKEAPGRILQGAGAAVGLTEPPPSSPLMDEFFSKTAYGRILRTMGQGLEQGWGDGPLSFAPETNDWLRKSGVYNDFTKGQQSLIKSFNEAWMRPAVTALGTLGELSLRGVNAIYTGAQGLVIGAGREGEQALLSAGLPGMDLGLLARDLATMPDAFMGGPGTAGAPPPRPAPVQTMARARSLGVIGEGEAGWRGTKAAEDPKVAQQRYIEAWREWDETQMGEPRPAEGPQPGISVKEGEGVAAAQAAEPLPDVHQVAREINPQLFERYDALDQRRETFRRWIDELDETRRQTTAEPFDRQIAELQGRMDGASARTAKRLQGEIDDISRQRDEALAAIKGDSPDMARIRQDLMNTDYEMRDLAPEVSAAYRQAREALPEEVRPTAEAPTEVPREPEAAPARPESEGVAAPEALQREAPAAVPEPPRQAELPLEAPRPAEPVRPLIADIAGDVRQKLEAAGRPAEEADAAAAIIASHYEARAARLGTTAQDLYAREAPEIKQGRERAPKREMEFAQKDKDGITYNQEGRAETDTDAFRNWFGESKVVDKKGAPLEVYHGSPDARDLVGDDGKFQSTKERLLGVKDDERAFFFAKDRNVAATYADDRRAFDYQNAEPDVVPVYLSLKNPKVVDWEGKKWRGTREAIEAARKEGHDGIIINNVIDTYTSEGKTREKPTTVYVAFSPEQIKSVFNRGTFDPNDPRILYQGNKVEEVFRGEGPGTGTGNYWTNDKEFARQFTRSGEDKQIKRRYLGQWDIYEAETLPRATNEAEIDAAIATAKEKGYKAIRVDEGRGEPPSVFVFDKTALKMTEAGARELEQSAKGKIRLFDDGRSVITLMKDADASTFMHETGHLWLEELMRDAKLEQAVQGLRDDAAAVRRWLGAADDAEITRAQHEKFARGFERYLMEGRAPNKELAGVFEQFRQWLTRIYETVTRLRSPINDEIRGVFDRLVAPERAEAVIAEDRKRGPDFADIHEADAKNTAPADAAVAADRIRAESDEIARRLLEDYDDIFGPRKEPEDWPGASVADATGRLPEPAGAPAGGGAGQGAAAADRGAVAGPAAGEAGGAAQPGAVGAGGGQPAAQGAGARGTGGAKQPQPVGPNDLLPPAETRLVDKAGNIRLDNLNIPEDVAQSIRQAAEESDEFMAARRGVVTDAQVLDLADALGMTPETLNTRQIGEAFNAEQIMAARKLLVQSATTVRDLMAKAAAGTDADVLAYAQAKARHMMIQEQVAGLTAEAGRALRAFRAFEGTLEAEQLTSFLKENTGKTLFQLRREAQLGAQLDTPGQVSKFVHDSKRPTFGDMIIEFWINALLSGPTTHVKNIVGNMAVAVNRVFETGLAGAIGEARRAVGVGPETGVALSEAKAAMFGTFQGAKDGVIAGAKAFMTEQVPVSGTVEQRKYQAIPSAKVTIGGRELEIGGKQVRLPGRFLAFQDEFFRAIAHRQELNALAFREADNLGLTGDAFRQKVADILMNPSDEMMEAARKAGEYQTFTRALGPVGLRLQQLANSHPLLKIVIPFVRTPTNILKYAFERTPFGLLSSEIRANLSGKNGGAAMDTQIARLTMGTVIGTAFAGLALEGLISGGGPSNPQEKAIMKGTGWEPYSIKIGEVWYNYDWLDPFATIMGLASDFAETAQRGIEEAQDADFWEGLGKVAAMTFGSVSKNLMSKLSLRGASELIQAVTDPDRYGERYLQGLAGTLVPSVVGQIARADDPVQREARNVLDAVKARIPGLRDTLYPSRDIWGEPLRADEQLGPDFGSPIKVSEVSQDPVNRKLVELRLWPSKPGRTIRGVELTDQQYDDYTRTAGRFAKMRLDALVALPQFNAAPDFVQRDMLRTVIENSRESARTLIMAQNPGIIQAAVDDKLRSLSGAAPRKGPVKQKAE